MSWWNELSRTKRSLLVLLLFVTVSAAVFATTTIIRPTVGCTLIGCNGGLYIQLAGLPPFSNYQISISSSQTGTQSLDCGPDATDESEPASFTACTPAGAYFSLAQGTPPPEEITVSVTLNGNQVSQVFCPEYTKFQPNGDLCPPVCYSAKVVMKVAP